MNPALRSRRGSVAERVVADLGDLTIDLQHHWQRTAIFHTRHESGRKLARFVDESHASLPHDPDVVRIRLGKGRLDQRPRLRRCVADRLAGPLKYAVKVREQIDRLRRVAWPNAEQAEVLAGLPLILPERICADRDVTDAEQLGLPTE